MASNPNSKSYIERKRIAETTSLRVVDRMPALIEQIEQLAGRAAYAGCTVLDRYQATNIPIETSALANNRSIRISKTKNRIKAVLKFHQKYAAAVNSEEMIGSNWQRPDAIDQWLTKSAEESEPDIKAEIDAVMKL